MKKLTTYRVKSTRDASHRTSHSFPVHPRFRKENAPTSQRKKNAHFDVCNACRLKVVDVLRNVATQVGGTNSATLDGASLEGDEEMQELWTAFLANALAEDPNDRRVPAAFPEILTQISEDAKLLNLLYEIRRKTILSVDFDSSVLTPGNIFECICRHA